MVDSRNCRFVGRVVGLWRYPVKSMRAEELSAVDVSWHGLAGDRRWAFVRNGVPQSGFPWLTLRERPEMNRYRPSFVDPARAESSPLIVTTPSGAVLDVVDPALGAELFPVVRSCGASRFPGSDLLRARSAGDKLRPAEALTCSAHVTTLSTCPS